jgi:hypothetical protein
MQAVSFRGLVVHMFGTKVSSWHVPSQYCVHTQSCMQGLGVYACLLPLKCCILYAVQHVTCDTVQHAARLAVCKGVACSATCFGSVGLGQVAEACLYWEVQATLYVQCARSVQNCISSDRL